jgi:hypothetical protein
VLVSWDVELWGWTLMVKSCFACGESIDGMELGAGSFFSSAEGLPFEI